MPASLAEPITLATGFTVELNAINIGGRLGEIFLRGNTGEEILALNK